MEERAAVLCTGAAARSCFVPSAYWDAGALLLGARVGLQVLDIVGRSLGLRCRMDQHGRVVVQDLHPALEVGRAVVEGGVRDAAHAAEM